MLLAFFSILQDWSYVYYLYNPDNPSSRVSPIVNVNFLSSVLFITAFIFINILNQKKNCPYYLQTNN